MQPNTENTICLNLIEAVVTLYPANADGTPQLGAPIWCGCDAENLHASERWLKRETMASGVRYPKKHLFVPQFEISIGRLWVLASNQLAGWDTAYTNYVLDIVWVEEETQEWHRKTFYGVTLNERSWAAGDVERGLVENQIFDAQYMVPAGGGGAPPAVIPATLPYRVVYTGADGISVLLYTYDAATHLFTAVATTTGRAIITSPFAVQFAGDAQPVLQVSATASLAYRTSAVYRNAVSYRQTALLAHGIFAAAALPADLPRLDFYYGNNRLATVTRAGVYDVDFVEGSLSAVPAGAFGLYGGGALVAVLAPGNLTAAQIEVTL